MSNFSKADAKGIVDVFYIVAWRIPNRPVSYHAISGRETFATNAWSRAFRFGVYADAKSIADVTKGAWVEKVVRERL